MFFNTKATEMFDFSDINIIFDRKVQGKFKKVENNSLITDEEDNFFDNMLTRLDRYLDHRK